ncbi:alpha/beta hydrolase [Algihabitans albus]|uniref:alpha/beta hydrolase n=1 Tax=Algihabitans albus TaxID=2164067 RepID=UPI000E5CFD41|nr:alpha/beta hydrolase [Algihabitans albus]
MTRWRILVFCGACLLIATGILLWRLEDHDLDRRTHESFAFEANDARLAGTLWLPEDRAIAAVALVHGDGPQDRIAAGGYAPLINALLDAGLAVASWDKPGIGGSEGAWLDQSMEDRAVETSGALDALARRMEGIPRGALGFSQAGWVLPRLSSEEADFIALVGPAVSWRDQGTYYTRIRLSRAGADAAEIARSLAGAALENERVFGRDARFDPDVVPAEMGRARWAFIQRNREEDSQAYLGRLKIPTLAIWGQEDLNVDAESNAAIYRGLLAGGHPANRIVIVPRATHGLLKESPYNSQLTSEWPWHTTLRFLWEGRSAYARGALAQITDWITARTGAVAHPRRRSSARRARPTGNPIVRSRTMPNETANQNFGIAQRPNRAHRRAFESR